MLILASTSMIRSKLLQNAGIPFTVSPPRIDEKNLQHTLEGSPPEHIPVTLAQNKACDVSARHPHAWILGCDQILLCEGHVLHKASNKTEAYKKLIFLRGKTHILRNHTVLAKAQCIHWQHTSQATLTMRHFSESFLHNYVEKISHDVLATVGAYQYEGCGIQLFQHIEGDAFSIMGLPLLPLLIALRERDIIPT